MFLDMLFLCEMRKMGTQNTYTEDAKILANTNMAHLNMARQLIDMITIVRY